MKSFVIFVLFVLFVGWWSGAAFVNPVHSKAQAMAKKEASNGL